MLRESFDAFGFRDFHVLWEPPGAGRPAGAGVTVRFDGIEWKPPRSTKHATTAAVAEAQREATARRQRFDATKRLGHLVRTSQDADGLCLDLGETSYPMFAATNLNLGRRLPGGAVHPFARSVRAAVGRADRTTEASQPYLASPLNVIGGLVTSDGFLIVPLRGPQVYERPLTLQASVGGFWERRDLSAGPRGTLVREAREELGIAIEPRRVRFLCFGLNCATGEPDLLAVARVRQGCQSLKKAYETGRDHEFTPEVYLLGDEGRGASFWDLGDRSDANLRLLIGMWRSAELWSQPSDRAVVLAVLIDAFGHDRIGEFLD